MVPAGTFTVDAGAFLGWAAVVFEKVIGKKWEHLRGIRGRAEGEHTVEQVGMMRCEDECARAAHRTSRENYLVRTISFAQQANEFNHIRFGSRSHPRIAAILGTN